MSEEEKRSMVETMMDEFFASMTSEEKKQMMSRMMPKMMEKMMEGLTAEDRQELMSSMMPAMLSQISGGEGGMPTMMMQMMRSMMEGENRPQMSVLETPADFKPWEFCPCRKLCEKAFTEKAKS